MPEVRSDLSIAPSTVKTLTASSDEKDNKLYSMRECAIVEGGKCFARDWSTCLISQPPHHHGGPPWVATRKNLLTEPRVIHTKNPTQKLWVLLHKNLILGCRE
jgi:hypothetical protein